MGEKRLPKPWARVRFPLSAPKEAKLKSIHGIGYWLTVTWAGTFERIECTLRAWLRCSCSHSSVGRTGTQSRVVSSILTGLASFTRCIFSLSALTIASVRVTINGWMRTTHAKIRIKNLQILFRWACKEQRSKPLACWAVQFSYASPIFPHTNKR